MSKEEMDREMEAFSRRDSLSRTPPGLPDPPPVSLEDRRRDQEKDTKQEDSTGTSTKESDAENEETRGTKTLKKGNKRIQSSPDNPPGKGRKIQADMEPKNVKERIEEVLILITPRTHNTRLTQEVRKQVAEILEEVRCIHDETVKELRKKEKTKEEQEKLLESMSEHLFKKLDSRIRTSELLIGKQIEARAQGLEEKLKEQLQAKEIDEIVKKRLDEQERKIQISRREYEAQMAEACMEKVEQILNHRLEKTEGVIKETINKAEQMEVDGASLGITKRTESYADKIKLSNNIRGREKIQEPGKTIIITANQQQGQPRTSAIDKLKEVINPIEDDYQFQSVRRRKSQEGKPSPSLSQ